MKILTATRLRGLTIAGLFCLTIPVLFLVLWINAFNQGTTQPERVAIFKGHFPDFLTHYTTLINIAFCILAIILSSISLSTSRKFWKILNIAVLVFGSLFLFLNLFSLM